MSLFWLHTMDLYRLPNADDSRRIVIDMIFAQRGEVPEAMIMTSRR
jgi:hypothetical protein